jgi:Cu+-exporting ATPase
MIGRQLGSVVLALLCVLAIGDHLFAGESARTTVTVERLCEGCAAKIQARLKKMPGVESTAANVKAKTIAVTAQPRATLSPRSLWEAIENSGERPLRLEGPSGTFTAKPQR